MAACSEERSPARKETRDFPNSLSTFASLRRESPWGDLSHVGFYDKPVLKFERILETYFNVAQRGFRQFLMAGPLWMKEKLFLDRQT